MKVLLTALNAKFIHTSLAIRYLAAASMGLDMEIKIREFTINDRVNGIVAAIAAEKADVTAFSCYIWNIGMILHIAEIIKKVYPDVKIVLGGPEVSFDPEDIMQKYEFIDYILVGEGEGSFPKLMEYLKKHQDAVSDLHKCPNHIKGLVYRKSACVDEDRSRDTYSIVRTDDNELVSHLDKLPTPYQGILLDGMTNKIAYIESSRGCPFSCSYCLSSATEGVRYLTLDRVRNDIASLIQAGVKQIKFVDRTFNCNKARAMELFKMILSLNADINFHFEAAADLFDTEMLDFLKTVPEGLFQFEIGVQSTNTSTLQMVSRKTNLEKLFRNVETLRETGNIHLHLDLIAGLPGEDVESFRKSFDQVYGLKPHQLQLGFLKLLKGSSIRQMSQKWGYVYDSNPPYEVLKNEFISYEELQQLKDLEELVEIYYNSGRFAASLDYLLNLCCTYGRTGGSFDFYMEFVRFWHKNSLFSMNPGSRGTYEALIKFGEFQLERKMKETEFFMELLKFDYLSHERNTRLPEGLNRTLPPCFKEKCFDFLKNEDNVKKYLPEYIGVPAKQIFKDIHFEVFDYNVHSYREKLKEFKKTDCLKNNNVVLFNYIVKDPVTARYKTILVDDFKEELLHE